MSSNLVNVCGCFARLQKMGSRVGLVLATAVAVASCDGSRVDEPDDGQSINTDPDAPAEIPSAVPALRAEPADELIRNSMLGFYTATATGNTREDVFSLGGISIAESAADSTVGTDSGGSSRFSDTNVQEAGVDEADRVKVDGSTLFALERISPQHIGVFPLAEEFALSDQIFPTQKIEQTLSAYTLDTVNSSTVSRLQIDTGNLIPDGMYLHKNGSSRDLVMLSRQSFNQWALWSYPRQWAGYQTRVSWFDASDPSSIKESRTMDFDGQLVSSRKIGNRLILVTRYHPSLDGIIAYPFTDAEFEHNRDLISGADAIDLLPRYEVTVNEVTTSSIIASNNECYRGPTGTANSSDIDDPSNSSLYYPSPSVISIVTIDLNSSNGNMQNTCFVGDTETMYMSEKALYLATTSYRYSLNDDGNGRLIADYIEPEITTEIHKFRFNSGQAPVFAGSGSVAGHLGWYQERKPYRMSEKDDNLRVVTFDQNRVGSPVTLNILAESSDATLRTLSTLPNDDRPEPIGKPGENLYASRFIGDRAYLVTFRVTDPLYVLDVGNPHDPFIVGELELPGYSDYLHPVNDGLLIGLGKDAIPATTNGWGDGRGAWYQGVKLALFDVSNPSEPQVADSRIIGKRGTESPALYQPHSFAYLPKSDNANARIAFPLVLHNETLQSTSPNAWSDWTANIMATIEVDERAEKFVDVSDWVFESREAGHRYSPVSLEDDRAIIGSDGGLYAIHNGSLFYGLWGEDSPSVNSR